MQVAGEAVPLRLSSRPTEAAGKRHSFDGDAPCDAELRRRAAGDGRVGDPPSPHDQPGDRKVAECGKFDGRGGAAHGPGNGGCPDGDGGPAHCPPEESPRESGHLGDLPDEDRGQDHRNASTHDPNRSQTRHEGSVDERRRGYGEGRPASAEADGIGGAGDGKQCQRRHDDLRGFAFRQVVGDRDGVLSVGVGPLTWTLRGQRPARTNPEFPCVGAGLHGRYNAPRVDLDAAIAGRRQDEGCDGPHHDEQQAGKEQGHPLQPRVQEPRAEPWVGASWAAQVSKSLVGWAEACGR